MIYFDAKYAEQSLFIALFIVGAASGIIHRPALARVGYLWVLLQLTTVAISPGPAHRYYLLEGGYALWIGGGLALFISGFAPQGSNRKRALNKTES